MTFNQPGDHATAHIGTYTETTIIYHPSKTQPQSRVPPPRPPIFHGRDRLINEIIDIILSPDHRHAALLGPGGFGKTSLAKAVLNDPRIEERFGTNRFFVRFDNVFSSQITYSTFSTRIAQSLGIPTSGDHDVISAEIKQTPTLLVLDNAETFQATDEIAAINDAINEFGSFPGVSILITSRRRDLPLGLPWKKFNVPALDAAAAYEVFTAVYGQQITDVDARATLQDILSTADHHPLTITLLAHTAEVNNWSIKVLSKHWEVRHTGILNGGTGKDLSLASSIELSLQSPALQSFGNDVRRVVRAIATFPQGIRENNLERLFQWVPQIQGMVNALRTHSLLMSKEDYITMLIPIRLYICDAIVAPDPAFLDAARNFYYEEMKSGSDLCENIIKFDDTNLESLIALDLQSPPRGRLMTTLGMDRFMTAFGMDHLMILTICAKFVSLLCHWKPRPTILFPIVLRVDASRSLLTIAAKFTCLYRLSTLALTLFNFMEVIRVQEASYDLIEQVGQKDIMILSTCGMAFARNMLGQHGEAVKLLQRVPGIIEREGLTSLFRGYLGFTLAYTQVCVDPKVTGSSVSALFYETARSFQESDNIWISNQAMAEGHLVFALIDNNIELARTKLKDTFDMVHATKDKMLPHLPFYLAITHFLEGNLEEAENHFILARNACELNEMWPFATITLVKMAGVTASQGSSHIDKGRVRMAKAKEEATTYGFISHVVHWTSLYISGVVEFLAGQMDEAQRYFQETKVYCQAHNEFRFRAFSTRAMGEIAYRRGNNSEAEAHFQQTWNICKDAGIVPSLLYRPGYFILYKHLPPATYEGWSRFLEKQPPMVW